MGAVTAPRPLLRLDGDPGGCLGDVANTLFDQIQHFFQLLGGRRGARVVDAYLPRVTSIYEVPRGLEYALNLRFAQPFPFVYNGADWSSPRLGGFTATGQDDPRPSEVLQSLLVLGRASAAEEYPTDRLTKAVLFVVHRQGFEVGIDYLAQVVESGFASSPGDSAHVLELVVSGQSQEGAGGPSAREWAERRLPVLRPSRFRPSMAPPAWTPGLPASLR